MIGDIALLCIVCLVGIWVAEGSPGLTARYPVEDLFRKLRRPF
jgi:hypothetical protein